MVICYVFRQLLQHGALVGVDAKLPSRQTQAFFFAPRFAELTELVKARLAGRLEGSYAVWRLAQWVLVEVVVLNICR